MSRVFKHGEIHLVDFDPSVGHEFQKCRPAIIIQSNETIKKTNLITIMALTSNIKGKTCDDILIKKNDKNSLSIDSVIKVQTIHAFDKSRFIKFFGETSEEILRQIKTYLKKHFDL